MKRLLALALALCAAAPAQPPAPSGPWSAAVRDNLLTQARSELQHYFFVDRIPKLDAAIEKNRARLVAISDPEKFAEATTQVLQSVTRDKHLNVFYSPRPQPRHIRPTAADRAKMKAFDDYITHGFGATARLNGNIGYFRIDGFAPGSASAKHMIDDAMDALSKTDGLIIDLRANGGGDPATVNYLLGYFFAEKTEVSGFLERKSGQIITERHYAATTLGAPKYLNRPVYLLTSGDTFSGGEQFAYDMQALKRATLVGQTTGGGANPGDVYPLNENFGIFVPFGTARNPITGTNWEGVGVIPEVKTSAKGALLEAYTRALHAAKDDADFAVMGRTHSLQNPMQALKDSLPEF